MSFFIISTPWHGEERERKDGGSAVCVRGKESSLSEECACGEGR